MHLKLAFCSVSLTCTPVNDLIFTQKILNTNLKSKADLLFPSSSKSLLKRHVVLAQFTALF